MKTKVAVAQLRPQFLNKTKSIEAAIKAIGEAGKNGAKLIVFPEAYISGYPDWVWLIPNGKGAELNKLYAELVENAISIPDDSTKLLCEAAKKHQINVVICVHEKNNETSGSSLFNAALLISDTGEIIGKHRKLIPTGGERTVWAQGDQNTFQTFETSAGVLGPLLCWENLMPLARYGMYSMGAQMLVAPTWDKSDNWLQTMQHNAREGGVFVLSCCMFMTMDDLPSSYSFKELYPTGREIINAGNSCIIGPKGNIIAGPLNAEEGLLYADLDMSEISEAKRMFDVVGHYSRPDVFNFSIRK